MVRTLRTLFPEVHSMRIAVPCFLGTWGIILASDWVKPERISAATIDRLIEKRLGNDWLKHLNGQFLIACFTHCKETRYQLSRPGPIIEDDVEFVDPPDVEDVEPVHMQLPALGPEPRP